jgi:hypothetical protein
MCKDGRVCGRRGNQLESDRQPQPTLTDEEKAAIALAKSRLGTSDGDWQADDVLAALLERLN